MIVLIKLLLAHFMGDFLLQPQSWVKDKMALKAKSKKLYFHALIHGGLSFLFLWDGHYWTLVLCIIIIHGGIDLIKLYAQKPDNKLRWFIIDQALHIISLLILWYLFTMPSIDFSEWLQNETLWIYVTALVFITFVSGIILKILLEKWAKILDDNADDSLMNAGKYIGILERLFVFSFIISGNWSAMGFLIAAKSVFRFGDLKESKNRKLTEYILIGTLISFGLAMGAGLLVLKITNSIA